MYDVEGYSGHIRPLKDKKGLGPNSSWYAVCILHKHGRPVKPVRSYSVRSANQRGKISVERSTWKDQRGKINLDRSTWKDQRGKINVKRWKWKDQRGKINVEWSTWKDQHENMEGLSLKDQRRKINVERSTWKDQRGKINVERSTWKDQRGTDERGKINVERSTRNRWTWKDQRAILINRIVFFLFLFTLLKEFLNNYFIQNRLFTVTKGKFFWFFSFFVT